MILKTKRIEDSTNYFDSSLPIKTKEIVIEGNKDKNQNVSITIALDAKNVTQRGTVELGMYTARGERVCYTFTTVDTSTSLPLHHELTAYVSRDDMPLTIKVDVGNIKLSKLHAAGWHSSPDRRSFNPYNHFAKDI